MVMKEKMQITAAMVVALCALYAVSPPLEWPPTSLAIRLDFEMANDAINNDVNEDAVNEDAVNQEKKEESPNLLADCCQSHLAKPDCCQETVAKLNNVVAIVIEPLKQELQAEVDKALSKDVLDLEEKLFETQAMKVYHTYNRADIWASGLAWALDGDHARHAIFKASNKAAEIAEYKKVDASKPNATEDLVVAAKEAAEHAAGIEKAAKAKADAGNAGQKGGDILCNYIFEKPNGERQYSVEYNSTEGCGKESKESSIAAKLKSRTVELRMQSSRADFPLAYLEGLGEFVPETSQAAISFRQVWKHMHPQLRKNQFGEFMKEGEIPLDKIPNFVQKRFEGVKDEDHLIFMIKAVLVGGNSAVWEVLNQEEWIKLGTALSPILSSFTFRAMDEVDKLIDSGCMQYYYESNNADCASNE